MEIGTIVKVNVPLNCKSRIKVIKTGKVIGIYPNFILLEFKGKNNKDSYRECYKKNEIIM